MKKSLLAVAAMTAFAGAAQAQSSVTVYGILDVGFTGSTSRATNMDNDFTTKTNKTSFSGTGSETTSRLGFKGNEDLGGGMSAFFTAEFQLYPTDATLSGNANEGLANRQTFVGLGKKGIGQAAIGTQYTPIHTAVGRTDPGQQNNMLGNVIYVTNSAQGAGQTTSAYTVRYNNSLTLATDRFAGFQVNGIYVNNNTDTTISAGGTTGGNTNNEAYGLGVNYVWQKLNVDLALNSSKQITNTGTVQTDNWEPGTGATRTAASTAPENVLGVGGKDMQWYAGATYDFGVLKAYAQYINRKATSGFDSNDYFSRTAQQIGVRSYITPTIEAWASAGTGRYNANGNGEPTANFTGYQVGSNYWLSKRTNLYAIFGSTQVSSTTVSGSAGANSYGVGARHTF